MSERSVIARRLREARLKCGLSQKQLGIKAGMDEFSASPRINQYESGRHTPDYSTVERLAKVLVVPVPYMYAREDDLAIWILAYNRIARRSRQEMLEHFAIEKDLSWGTTASPRPPTTKPKRK